jgi:hypothetical protein
LTSNSQCGPGETNMRKLWQFLIRSNKRTCAAHPTQQASEKGQSLPAALIALAVGALLLTPFLGFVSSRTLGTGTAEKTFNELYAADAGIEYGIWSLLNVPSFRAQVDLNAGNPQPLAFPGAINGSTPTISITGLPIGNWYVRQPADWNIGKGGSLAYAGGDCVYALRGDKQRDFSCYSISGNSWSSLTPAPGKVNQGGSLVRGDGNYLYALQGDKKDKFWRYDISSNTWVVLDDIPEKVDKGGALVYNGGNYLFAFSGNSNLFWRYDISSPGWSSRADAPGATDFGADLVYTGGSHIYAIQGKNSSAFWHYSISGNTWSTLPNTPADVNNGGALAYYGGDYLYGLRGNSTEFWRYAVTMKSWTVLTAAPDSVGWGADLEFTHSEGGFSLRGGKQPDFWEFEVTPPRYDISSQAGALTTDARLEIDGGSRTILFWDIE